ncbi:hypothetical protein GJAV_G00190650 [Gymnothorax javanicus]|nr:hypothetical protein GJAV_G00190650 [Gymnothorax javanicus]
MVSSVKSVLCGWSGVSRTVQPENGDIAGQSQVCQPMKHHLVCPENTQQPPRNPKPASTLRPSPRPKEKGPVFELKITSVPEQKHYFSSTCQICVFSLLSLDFLIVAIFEHNFM